MLSIYLSVSSNVGCLCLPPKWKKWLGQSARIYKQETEKLYGGACLSFVIRHVIQDIKKERIWLAASFGRECVECYSSQSWVFGVS